MHTLFSQGHIQRVRHSTEADPIPGPRESKSPDIGIDIDEAAGERKASKLERSIDAAKAKVSDIYATSTSNIFVVQ